MNIIEPENTPLPEMNLTSQAGEKLSPLLVNELTDTISKIADAVLSSGECFDKKEVDLLMHTGELWASEVFDSDVLVHNALLATAAKTAKQVCVGKENDEQWKVLLEELEQKLFQSFQSDPFTSDYLQEQLAARLEASLLKAERSGEHQVEWEDMIILHFSPLISKFKKESLRAELAKIAINRHFVVIIQHCAISNEQERYKLFRRAIDYSLPCSIKDFDIQNSEWAWNCIRQIFINIKANRFQIQDFLKDVENYRIFDEQTRFFIAEKLAQNGVSLSHIRKLDIQDEGKWLEIVETSVIFDHLFVEHVNDDNTQSPTARFEMLKIAATSPACSVSATINKASKTIQEYAKEQGISEQDVLLELAEKETTKLRFGYHKDGTYSHFKNYGIQDPAARAKIAKMAASSTDISEDIDQFELLERDRKVVVWMIAQRTLIDSSTFELYQSSGSLNPLDLVKIYCILHPKQDAIQRWLENAKFYGRLEIDEDVAAKLIALEKGNPAEVLEFLQQLATPFSLDWFSPNFLQADANTQNELASWLLSILWHSPKDLLSTETLPVLENIKKLRTQVLRDNVQEAFYRLTPEGLKEIQKSPMGYWQAKIVLSLFPQVEMKENLKLLTWFQDSGKNESFLDFVFFLNDRKELSSAEKIALLSWVLDVDYKERSEIITAMKSIVILGHAERLRKLLESEKTTQALKEEMKGLFAKSFQLQEQQDLIGRYENSLGKYRKNHAIFTYRAALSQNPQALSYLSLFVQNVLDETFKDKRYEGSKQLKIIQQSHPQIVENWMKGSKPLQAETLLQSTSFEPTKNEVFSPTYFRDFLKLKIFVDGHIKNADQYEQLKKCLDSPTLETIEQALKALNVGKEATPQNKIEACCLRLLRTSIKKEKEPKDKQALVKELTTLASLTKKEKEELQNDLSEPLTRLAEKATGKSGQLTIEDTDDPCDLLLIGTEVQGSCQRVDGNPRFNKGLLAYLLDGKHRAVVVKNKEGAIVARSIVRLLMDEKTGQPVLFQERLYTAYSDPKLGVLVTAMCKQRAQSLGIPLVSMDQSEGAVPYPNGIQGVLTLPFEYVDAASGMQSNDYTLQGFHKEV